MQEIIGFFIFSKARYKRQKLELRIELHALVDLRIHMDGKSRNDRNRLLGIDQMRDRMESVFSFCTDLACNAERSVQPACIYSAAIRLDIEFAIASLCQLRLWFYQKRRPVCMRRDHTQLWQLFACRDFLADRKGNAGCVVKIDIIFSAGCKGNRLIFGKCKKAGFLERVLAVFTAVERGMGTLRQYGECIYGGSCICLHDKSPSLKISITGQWIEVINLLTV